MITIAITLIKAKPQKHLVIAIQKSIYGIGARRAQNLVIDLTGRLDIPIKIFTSQHFRWFTIQCLKKAFILNIHLKFLKRSNIKRLKLLKCYRGLRHKQYLPVHGQRTKSNAITSRYLGSGSFDYIPKRPTIFLKKINSYIKRDTGLKKQSEIRYKKLLQQNFSMFQKQYSKLANFLNKKGKLGVFNKFIKVNKKNLNVN